MTVLIQRRLDVVGRRRQVVVTQCLDCDGRGDRAGRVCHLTPGAARGRRCAVCGAEDSRPVVGGRPRTTRAVAAAVGPDREVALGVAMKELRRRAGLEPLGVDISDFSDEWCAGFLAGQENVVEFLGSRDEAPVRLVVTGRAEALAKLEQAGERVHLAAERVRRAWVGIGITLGEITLAEQEHGAAVEAFESALAACVATRNAQ